MREAGDSSHDLVNCAVRDSLNTIKQAYAELHLLTGTPTATALASQIGLFDVLLVEISGIQTRLARDIGDRGVMPRARVTPHVPAPAPEH
jgi:hypothetical protein